VTDQAHKNAPNEPLALDPCSTHHAESVSEAERRIRGMRGRHLRPTAAVRCRPPRTSPQGSRKHATAHNTTPFNIDSETHLNQTTRPKSRIRLHSLPSLCRSSAVRYWQSCSFSLPTSSRSPSPRAQVHPGAAAAADACAFPCGFGGLRVHGQAQHAHEVTSRMRSNLGTQAVASRAPADSPASAAPTAAPRVANTRRTHADAT